MNIQELQAKVDALKVANTEVVRERVEIARLTATIALEESPVLLEARVKLAAKDEQTQILQRIVDECEGIISTVPIHNPKTRSDRKWAGNHRFAYGTQIDLLYQLATGILYSCQEHKQLLMAHTNANPELLEQFLDAFGTPAYYSRNHHVIMDATPFDIDALHSTLQMLQSSFGVIIDTSRVTEGALVKEFNKAEATANANYTSAVEAIESADFVL
jgi:hypothetical protein